MVSHPEKRAAEVMLDEIVSEALSGRGIQAEDRADIRSVVVIDAYEAGLLNDGVLEGIIGFALSTLYFSASGEELLTLEIPLMALTDKQRAVLDRVLPADQEEK